MRGWWRKLPAFFVPSTLWKQNLLEAKGKIVFLQGERKTMKRWNTGRQAVYARYPAPDGNKWLTYDWVQTMPGSHCTILFTMNGNHFWVSKIKDPKIRVKKYSLTKHFPSCIIYFVPAA